MPPTDPHLYPHHKPKNTPKEISTSSSLAFTSTLSSLLSSSSSTNKTAPGRSRPSKTKSDIFTTHNKNSKKRAARDLEEIDDEGRERGRKAERMRADGEVDDVVLSRSKRKMEEKVKRYKEMKRGGLLGGDNNDLIDFDRKWAERGRDSSSDSEEGGNDRDNGEDAVIDYEDEYGRLRRGTKAEAEKMERKKKNQLLGAEELDRMSARPAAPANLIYGDTVQTLAFNPEDEKVQKMEELAKKRDRSLTPPEMGHYDGGKEVRSKGVGWYGFSRDEGGREREMRGLEEERERTERVREEKRGKVEERKAELERRRREVGERRARKQAESFLEGLEGELGRVEGVEGGGGEAHKLEADGPKVDGHGTGSIGLKTT